MRLLTHASYIVPVPGFTLTLVNPVAHPLPKLVIFAPPPQLKVSELYGIAVETAAESTEKYPQPFALYVK